MTRGGTEKAEECQAATHWAPSQRCNGLVIRFFVLSFVICHLSFRLLAADLPSSIEGEVTDWATQEPVADVSVVVTGEDRLVTREITSAERGGFRFIQLPPGRYSVTAAKKGWSTVTLVGVVVHPGERRIVSIEVTKAAEDESVTETVTSPVVLSGLTDVRAIPLEAGGSMPLFEGTALEVAALVPGGSISLVRSFGTALPVEALSVGSVALSSSNAEVGRASGGLVVAIPISGREVSGTVRVVYGDRAAGKDHGGDWFRGALTAGVVNQGAALSGFLSVDHHDGEKTRRFAERYGVHGSLTGVPHRMQWLKAEVWWRNVEAMVDRQPFGAATAPVDGRDNRWLLRGAHGWQLSPTAVNDVVLSAGRHAVRLGSDDCGCTGDARDERRVKDATLEDRVAWLAGQHEMRLGGTLRIERERMRSTDSEDSDAYAMWFEDEWRSGRWSVSGGVRLETWRGDREEGDEELSPRLAVALEARPGTVIRGSWARFTEAVGTRFASALDRDAGLLRTDRATIGITHDMSGLTALSLDVASSRSREAEHERASDFTDVTFGARASLFGKADALASYSWRDGEGDLPDVPADAILETLATPAEWPRHRASLAVRASLPARWETAAVVRHEEGRAFEHASHDEAHSRTGLDLVLARSFQLGPAPVRAALEGFDVTNDDGRRSVALNLFVRFE